MAKKRAFVSYSKQGKIVPGSLILTNGSYPNSPSLWKEVPADLCCVSNNCCNETAFGAFSWQNNYFNVAENADQYIPFDTEIFNTDSSVFELVNSGSTAGSNGSQGARIYFKKAGIYEITSQMHFYDITDNIDFLVKLSSAANPGDGMNFLTLINDYKSVESPSDQLMNGTIMIEVTSPGYYGIAVTVSDPNGNQGPYPSNADNTPPRIFIKKLA
jgi:hypothetical protein